MNDRFCLQSYCGKKTKVTPKPWTKTGAPSNEFLPVVSQSGNQA